MIDNRLWRPAAQRRVRNAWGYIQAQLSVWSSASNAARSAATNLVNAHLSYSDVGVMDLGVLRDVEGIQDKAKIKLRSHQEMYLREYLGAYDTLVKSVFEMRDVAASMRTYAKHSGGELLIEFTGDPVVDGDTGDGGGVAVFSTLPLGVFEMLAKELVTMFRKELKVKWLLSSEFCNLVYPRSEEARLKGKEHHVGNSKPVLPEKDSDTTQTDSITLDCKRKPPSREVLQVYLTALLAEVHINKDRTEEISRLWSEEMAIGFNSSPQC